MKHLPCIKQYVLRKRLKYVITKTENVQQNLLKLNLIHALVSYIWFELEMLMIEHEF